MPAILLICAFITPLRRGRLMNFSNHPKQRSVMNCPRISTVRNFTQHSQPQHGWLELGSWVPPTYTADLCPRKGIGAVKFPPQLSPPCVDIIKATADGRWLLTDNISRTTHWNPNSKQRASWSVLKRNSTTPKRNLSLCTGECWVKGLRLWVMSFLKYEVCKMYSVTVSLALLSLCLSSS